MAIERKNLCPNCGARLSGLELKCPECGYVLMGETAGSQHTTDAILDLQEKLLAVDKVFNQGKESSRKKASIINSFPISNTAESLSRLLHFSYSNFEATKESGDMKLAVAWLGKAIEAYRRLSGLDNDASVAGILDKYKFLEDRKALSKLSGNHAKKRRIIAGCLTALALLASFVIWYDWAGLLVKSGNDEVAVRLLNFMGRTEKAIQVLSNAGHFEKAANILISRGETRKAVSLLSQNGLIKDALIITGTLESADSIHLYVNEICKYCLLKDRVSYLPYQDQLIGVSHNDQDSTQILFYRADYSLRRHEVSTYYGLSWSDNLRVMNDIFIPEPSEFRYSEFINDYYRNDVWILSDSDGSKVERIGSHTISKIELASIEKAYEFSYSGVFTGLLSCVSTKSCGRLL